MVKHLEATLGPMFNTHLEPMYDAIFNLLLRAGALELLSFSYITVNSIVIDQLSIFVIITLNVFTL